MSDRLEWLASRRGLGGDVYEPAEDSGLLASAVIPELTGDEFVLDVGTGTGYVAHRIREAVGATVVGIDVNPHACQRAMTAGIPAIRGDLVTAITDDVADVITCNPPYLPTDPALERNDWLATAVSGGPTGRDVVNRLLVDCGRVLVPDGRVYLLVSSLMDLDAVRNAASDAGFASTEVDRDASFPFEVLAVLRLERR